MTQPNMHSAKRFLRPLTFGIFSGALACSISLILMSFVMGLQDMPQAVISLFATISFVVGGFLAGYVAAVLAQEKGLFLGLLCGLILFGILLAVRFSLSGDGVGAQGLTTLICVLIASAIGGILGVNKRKKFR